MKAMLIIALAGSGLFAGGLSAGDAPKKKAGEKVFKKAAAPAPASATDAQKGEALHREALRLRAQSAMAHQRAQRAIEQSAKDQELAEKLEQEATAKDREAGVLLKEDPVAFELIQKSHREQRMAEMQEARARALLSQANQKSIQSKSQETQAKSLQTAASTETDPKVKENFVAAAAALLVDAKEHQDEAQKVKTEADKITAMAKDYREKAKKDLDAALKIDPDIEKKFPPAPALPPGTPRILPPTGASTPPPSTPPPSTPQ